MSLFSMSYGFGQHLLGVFQFETKNLWKGHKPMFLRELRPLRGLPGT